MKPAFLERLCKGNEETFENFFILNTQQKVRGDLNHVFKAFKNLLVSIMGENLKNLFKG